MFKAHIPFCENDRNENIRTEKDKKTPRDPHSRFRTGHQDKTAAPGCRQMKAKMNPLRVVHNVLRQAQKSEDAKHKPVESAGLSPQMTELRAFQVERIANTYRDFAAQPQYAPVLEFFTNDLYAARDFTQRDHDAQRVHAFLQKFVPAEMLKLATDAIELTRLSYALDEALLRVLVDQTSFKDKLTPELYAEAYRRCNNANARERQIELLVRVMNDSAETAHMPLTGVALKLAKGPAHAAGWHELFAFLERGHQAFAQVKHPERFLEAIQERESEIMRRILAREANPFHIT
jgi:hypothetical protein